MAAAAGSCTDGGCRHSLCGFPGQARSEGTAPRAIQPYPCKLSATSRAPAGIPRSGGAVSVVRSGRNPRRRRSSAGRVLRLVVSLGLPACHGTQELAAASHRAVSAREAAQRGRSQTAAGSDQLGGNAGVPSAQMSASSQCVRAGLQHCTPPSRGFGRRGKRCLPLPCGQALQCRSAGVMLVDLDLWRLVQLCRTCGPQMISRS